MWPERQIPSLSIMLLIWEMETSGILCFFFDLNGFLELIIVSNSDFRLSYYPHRLQVFRSMLKDIFGHTAKSSIYGDFQPLNEIEDPAFYIHVIEKLK